MGAIMKDTRNEFEWFPRLILEGPHSLRHGGCVWLRMNESLRQDQRLEQAHLSNGVFKGNYPRTNEERDAAVTVTVSRKRPRE